MINFDSDFGKRVLKRLEQEVIIWLTTVDAKNTPQPRPVWFHWDGETVLIFSQAEGAKLRHIHRNPRVALNFNSSADGGDVVVLLGEAAIVDEIGAERLKDFVRKYRQGIKDIGMTPESFEADYKVAIVVKPVHLRGF
jgi:PPOX class probable F420-dependent enzyme